MKKRVHAFVAMVSACLVFIGCNDSVEPSKEFCNVEFYDGSAKVYAETVEFGSKLKSVPALEDGDYHFAGWYTDSGVSFADNEITVDAVYHAKKQIIVNVFGSDETIIRTEYCNLRSEQNIAPAENFNDDEGRTYNFCFYSEDKNALSTEKSSKELKYFGEASPVNLYAIYEVSCEVSKKEADWVVAFYMDGDNDLNDPLWLDINEMESGLNEINKNPFAYDSVIAVALWDGWSSKETHYGKSGSYLYELGPDAMDNFYTPYDEYYNSTSENDLSISSATKDLSYTADWLVKNKDISDPESAYGEVNMGSKDTLVNYLKWVDSHYSAKKGIIVQFSDHGGGPRSVRYAKTADGKHTVDLKHDGRKALCWDEGSKKDFLKTSEVAQAFREAGFGPERKISMIVMDVCLGASIEDAYEFRDYADYMVASPNTIPGEGLYYVDFMKSFTKGTDIKAIGKKIVRDYKKFYEGTYFDVLAQEYEYDTFQDAINAGEDTESMELGDGGYVGIPTLSFMDLSKSVDVKEALNKFAEVLINGKDREFIVKGKDDSETKINYSQFIVKNSLGWYGYDRSVNIYDSMSYMGSFTWLYDAGYIAVNAMSYSYPSGEGKVNPNAWKELYNSSADILESIRAMNISSWRDSMISEEAQINGMYAYYDGENSLEGHPFGITVCGCTVYANQKNYLDTGYVPDFYKTELDFGRDTKWAEMLSLYFLQ